MEFFLCTIFNTASSAASQRMLESNPVRLVSCWKNILHTISVGEDPALAREAVRIRRPAGGAHQEAEGSRGGGGCYQVGLWRRMPRQILIWHPMENLSLENSSSYIIGENILLCFVHRGRYPENRPFAKKFGLGKLPGLSGCGWL